MSNIKILDCTLRDGGYINNWYFGINKSQIIINLLQKAKIDYIEVGFLTLEKRTNNQTLFNSFEEITNFLPVNCNKSNLFGMITYGKFPIEKVPRIENSSVNGIRVIFKKNEKENALKYCEKIKTKGYKLFINPTFTDQYSDKELLEMLKQIAKINPYGISIVDSMGVMKEKDLLRLYYLIDNNLDKNISLCFHSHNNLQLSFSNAQCLMEICNNRELIIDSTVFGMGRGAGNLCTELITQYINDNYNGNYDIVPILKIIDEHINPIFAKTPWGYSVPYYLAATNHCHPNYAKYLVDKQTVPVEFINDLLKSIPNEKKTSYDIDLIKQLYIDKISSPIDDIKTVDYLKNLLLNKNILVLAPGKTLTTQEEKIKNFIKENNPFIISLNFNAEKFDENLLFITNIKRFSAINNIDKPLCVTSNIYENIPNSAMKLNYSSYLNNSKMFDNVALILLNLFIKIGIKEITFAGLDGFSNIVTENYANNNMINNAKVNEFDERNEIMQKQIEEFAKDIKIHFLTESKYNNSSLILSN